MLVTSDFSFSHNVFHSYISLVRQNAVLCGNGLACVQVDSSRDTKILEFPRFNMSADDTFNLTFMLRFVFERVKRIVFTSIVFISNKVGKSFVSVLQIAWRIGQSFFSTMSFISQMDFNPFSNKPWFLHVCITSLLKTLWEKEKLLTMSNFSFSHSVFY